MSRIDLCVITEEALREKLHYILVWLTEGAGRKQAPWRVVSNALFLKQEMDRSKVTFSEETKQ